MLLGLVVLVFSIFVFRNSVRLGLWCMMLSIMLF